MKILFYNHTGKVSGAERLLLMILSRLDRENFQSLVLCPKDGPLVQMVEELDLAAETLPELNARFTWRPNCLVRYLRSFLTLARALRARVANSKPDVIHANSIRAGLAATVATFGLGIPVVWHLHDLLPRHPLSSAIRAFAFLSLHARMIAVSRAVADNFCGSFFPLYRRVSVILNAIDLARFRSDDTVRRETRAELQLDDKDLAIGIVGQLTPRKGQLELVKAFAKTVNEIPQGVLIVVGAPLFNRDEDYAELLRCAASELNDTSRTRILGHRNDIGRLMQAFDLLVVNSSVEPFGLVILEAMACGTPVLATRADGIPEIIQHQRNGWLLPTGDEAALIGALVELGTSAAIRSQLAVEGRKHVAASFTVDRYMADFQSFYQGLAQQNVVNQEKTGGSSWLNGLRNCELSPLPIQECQSRTGRSRQRR